MKSYCHIIKHRWLDPLPMMWLADPTSNFLRNLSHQLAITVKQSQLTKSQHLLSHSWQHRAIDLDSRQVLLFDPKNYDTSTATWRVGPINSDTLEIRSHQIYQRPYIWHVLNNQPLISTWETERGRWYRCAEIDTSHLDIRIKPRKLTTCKRR